MSETGLMHRLPVSTPTLYPATTTNVYIIADQGEALIIDGGYENPAAAKEIIDYVTKLGNPKVTGILLTHYHQDHSPGAKALADFYQCPIACHALEKEAVEKQISPYTVQITYQEGDMITVGSKQLQVLHTPGHTRGHLSLWLETEKLLVTGDNIVAEGTTWIGPPDGDLTDYLQTLHRFLELKPALIAPGHGEWVHDTMAKIEFFIQRRLEREQQVLRLLAEQPRNAAELVQAIYAGQVHPSVLWVAERTVLGHLEKLMRENKIAKTEDGSYRTV
ncbi:MBL fold metallo-hydrolase [Effusibacillus dendaii]|uniref:MBL fold metallo-hydrolase n=1 Tax=Effusibacillus dendaii TaxID=2743772 RepID=A0A7I8DDG7_9BACL|nr:MBL fold metallo-hydrolase [Effusibacillus dendaii]BCJ88263.1 MBL fold metallo-hydrolase [Effusibacillus dendaii]